MSRELPAGGIEIVVPAGRFAEIRDRFSGYVFDAVGDMRIWENAGRDALAATHQTWVRDPRRGSYLLDVFREPHDGGTWICRRDEVPLMTGFQRARLAALLRRVHPGHPWIAALEESRERGIPSRLGVAGGDSPCTGRPA